MCLIDLSFPDACIGRQPFGFCLFFLKFVEISVIRGSAIESSCI